eukprot:gene11947-biopygen8984
MPRSRSRGAQPEGERAALSPAEVPFAAGTAGGTAGIMAAWRQSGGKGNLVPAEKCGGEECCGGFSCGEKCCGGRSTESSQIGTGGHFF